MTGLMVNCYRLQENEAPIIFEVQDGFPWPHFFIAPSILDRAGLLPLTTDKGKSYIQLYKEDLGVWVAINTDHVIIVHEGARIFLKLSTVSICDELDEYIDPPSRRSGLRTDLTRERAFVRDMEVKAVVNKANRTQDRKASSGTTLLLPALSSSHPIALPSIKRESSLRKKLPPPKRSRDNKGKKREVEVIEVHSSSDNGAFNAPFITAKAMQEDNDIILISSDDDDLPEVKKEAALSSRTLKADPYLPTPPIKGEVKKEATSSSRTLIKADPYSPTSSSTSTSYSSPSLSPEPALPTRRKCWPADFYAIDIDAIFRETKKFSSKGNGIREVFENRFQVPFKRTTFYDHRRRWRAAGKLERNMARSGGHTDTGLWSTFMGRNPAMDAMVKSARRRLRKRQVKSDDESLSEDGEGSDGSG
jgi:hypothetical protein